MIQVGCKSGWSRAQYVTRTDWLSLIFICRENPRRSGILPFCRPSQVLLIYRIFARGLSQIFPIIHDRGTGAQQFRGLVKRGFHISGKSQTVWKFTVSRPSQICRLMKTQNRRYPRSSGMNRDKSGESGAFLFSRRVPDFCDVRRSFPTNENSNLYRREPVQRVF